MLKKTFARIAKVMAALPSPKKAHTIAVPMLMKIGHPQNQIASFLSSMPATVAKKHKLVNNFVDKVNLFWESAADAALIAIKVSRCVNHSAFRKSMSEPNEIPQDSRPDTIAHITRVQSLMDDAINNLARRALKHDLSKLEEPEKSAFDRLKALSLSGMAYGSEEYRACLRAEKPAITHHYKANSHHPEYYDNGVDGMTLFDVLEMLVDWKAATERMKDGGDIRASLVHNTERFKLSSQLAQILENTIREFNW